MRIGPVGSHSRNREGIAGKSWRCFGGQRSPCALRSELWIGRCHRIAFLCGYHVVMHVEVRHGINHRRRVPLWLPVDPDVIERRSWCVRRKRNDVLGVGKGGRQVRQCPLGKHEGNGLNSRFDANGHFRPRHTRSNGDLRTREFADGRLGDVVGAGEEDGCDGGADECARQRLRGYFHLCFPWMRMWADSGGARSRLSILHGSVRGHLPVSYRSE